MKNTQKYKLTSKPFNFNSHATCIQLNQIKLLQKKKQSSKCKNINNSQNPKGETKTEVYMPKKKGTNRLDKTIENRNLKFEPLKEERRSSADLEERRRSSGRLSFPSVIVVI
jgi:hypothetical protein